MRRVTEAVVALLVGLHGVEGCSSSSTPSGTLDASTVPDASTAPDAGAAPEGGEDAGTDAAGDSGCIGTTTRTTCVIDGATYWSGSTNPTNACQTCQPAVCATGWSTVPDGTLCTSTQSCVAGSCTGCVPGRGQCSGSGSVQGCNGGKWSNAVSCPADSPDCLNGACIAATLDGGAVTPPSCLPGGPGIGDCAGGIESCCTSLEVAGGTFHRTYTNTGDGGTGENDPATVSGFRLDKYEVTVGRFRQFVAAWNNGAGWVPSAGSGKHVHLNSGLGLVNSGATALDGGVAYETGWIAGDEGNVWPSSSNLGSVAPDNTWTDSAGSKESLPIMGVNWYEAYAFCIWDGGFLPSEAEWEYAAAGGSEEREYPWGSADPTTGAYATYNCCKGGTCGTGCTGIAPVGTPTAGAGRWGQLDLAGSVWERSLDSAGPYVSPSTDGAYLVDTGFRDIRGGDFSSPAPALVPTLQGYSSPFSRGIGGSVGVRCARTP